jgi:anti-sigma regulatory factor (Ser/Thr protein kinase)
MFDEVEIVVASNPRWLRVIRSAVLEFAEEVGCDSKDRREIALAVGEAASNVMKHAYRGDHNRKLSVRCRDRDSHFEVEIHDDGEPFDETQFMMRPPNEMRAGGRGVYLMKAVMDEVEYGREGGRNFVRMRKLVRTHAR